MTSSYPTSTEVLSAFLDNERFDPADLAAALAAPGGRDLLLDLVALRQLVQDDAASDHPATRSSLRGSRWVAVAAAACVVLASGYWLGRESGHQDHAATAPQPTQVIELQEGVNWNVPAAERSNGGR